jgi:hypothetical protein
MSRGDGSVAWSRRRDYVLLFVAAQPDKKHFDLQYFAKMDIKVVF